MADFRQNSPALQTAVSGESYSTNSASGVATTLGAGANAFTSFVSGLDAAATREYRAASESRAQRAEQRDITKFNMDVYKFDREEQERDLSNRVASATTAVGYQNFVDSLKRIGVTPDGNFMDISTFTEADFKALGTTADEINRVRTSYLSGPTRDSFRMAIQLRRLETEAIARNSQHAAFIKNMFKEDTGRSFEARLTEMQDFIQSRDINSAKTAADARDEFRAKNGLEGLPDDKVDLIMRNNYLAADRALRASQAATMSNASADINRNARREALVNATPSLISGAAGIYADIRLKVGQRTNLGTRPLSPAEEQAFTEEVNTVFAEKIAQEARRFGVTPQELLAEVPSLAESRDAAIASFSSVEGAKRYEGANKLLIQAEQFDWFHSNPEAARSVMTLEVLKGVPEALLSYHGKRDMSIAGSNAVDVLLNSLGTAASGGRIPGVGGSAGATPGQRSANIQGGEMFAGTLIGAYVPNDNPANPFDNITLDGARSASNIPPRLMPQRGINRSLNTRLNVFNSQLRALAEDGGRSDPKIMEGFLKFAADRATVGTFYIDPETLSSTRQLLYAYNGKLVRAMIEDLPKERGVEFNTAAFAATGGAVMPVDWGSVSLGTGVRMRELPDGGVTFEVNPTNLNAEQRGQAARLAATFNRKYAPGIRTMVRAYAHTMQADHFDYRGALADILRSGTAMGGDLGGDTDPFIQGAIELQSSSPNAFGQFTIDELANDLRRRNSGK